VAATPAGVELGRPLRVGELIAAAVRIYSNRGLPFLAVGLVQAGAFLTTVVLPFALDLVVLSVAFAVAFAATVRLVVGDSLESALQRTGAAVPGLLVLALVVGVPFYLGSGFLLLLILSVGWLGLTGFAIPALMIEETDEPSRMARAADALRRSLTLARVDYLHAVGVTAALVIIYILIGVVLALALFGFADSGRVAALALAQIVLAPFFFIGLSVLYFEQRARSLESAGRPGKGG
jgi:hypothetical protein